MQTDSSTARSQDNCEGRVGENAGEVQLKEGILLDYPARSTTEYYSTEPFRNHFFVITNKHHLRPGAGTTQEGHTLTSAMHSSFDKATYSSDLSSFNTIISFQIDSIFPYKL